MARTKKLKVRIAAAFLLAALMFSGAAIDAGAKGGEASEPFVPVWPGVKWLYDKVSMNMVKPHLEESGGDALFAADLAAESMMGASNYATALGNGRLSVEVSPWGELAVFRWPNPTFTDQLRYFTQMNGITLAKAVAVRMGEDAPTPDWRRYSRPIEPCPELGSSGAVMTESGSVLWAHDPVWESSREYEPPDSTILSTTLKSGDVTMTVKDFIHPDLDLMVRAYDLGGPVRRFFYHGTFAPFKAGPGEYTDPDPKKAGFAAVYLAQSDAVVHFYHEDRDRKAALELISGGVTAELLDLAYPAGGVFIAYGFIEGSDGFQVGPDSCEGKGTGALSGGVLDSRDGELENASYYIGKADSALVKDFEEGGHRTVTLAIAVSESAAGAVDMIEKVRAEGAARYRDEAADSWRAVWSSIQAPKVPDPGVDRVIRRSVVNLIQGQDKEGGCVVASISRQPAYNYDWPRDGAFFDLTLDMAGFPEKVSLHHDFYRRTQMTGSMAPDFVRIFNYRLPFYKPEGHWPSNMAADGTPGSIPSILAFEIDETALSVWNFWRHARVLSGEERSDYISRTRGTMRRSANALCDYVDMRQGWTRPAIEDDSFPPDATLHGVAAVLTGLAAAGSAKEEWGFDRTEVEKWRGAASVLREGIRSRIEDPRIHERAGWRGLAWSLWPAPVFDDFDEPGAVEIKRELAARIEEKMNKRTPGFAYLGEEIFTLALADREKGEYRELLEDALVFLANEVPFPGTDCYGEVTMWVEMDGRKLAQQRTSIPHLWNGVTVYLAAMALYEPEAFDPMKPDAP